MAQATVFPIRFGLPLQPPENKKAVEVLSEGGLDLTQSIIENRPGCASQLINFEASLTGGYRRINGYQKFSSTAVPGQGNILGVAIAWPDQIIAARQDGSDITKYNVYKGSGTTWTQLNPSPTTLSGTTHGTTTLDVTTAGLVPGQPITGGDVAVGAYIVSITDGSHLVMSAAATGSSTSNRTFANPLNYQNGLYVTSCFYDWSGPIRTAFTDGVNWAYRWDNVTGFTMLVGTAAAPAPRNPQWASEFDGYLFLGGFSSNAGAIAWSAPNLDNDWASVDGANTVVVGDVITGMREWRNQLIVFCDKSISKVVPNSLNLTGVTPPPAFQVQPITHRIGCPVGRTIQECNGDILYLAPDGVRTISGTFNIGDTEIGSISRPIQNLFNGLNYNITPPMALVVHKKTQYRLFIPDYTLPVTGARGIMGTVRRFRDGREGWEWSVLQGFQPTAVDSGYLADGNEYSVHGDSNGFIYRQESGSTLNGNAVNEVYTTVPLEMGDIGIRKAIQRVTVYVSTDSQATTLALNLIYDYENPGILEPPTYILANVGNTAPLYDNGTLYNSGAGYGIIANTTVRQLVQGSGFVVQLQIAYTGAANLSSPYTIQGFYIEYFPGGRR